jgi:hypothetical protein
MFNFNPSKLEKRLDQYDFISFDIFDTLIKRDVSHPKDVFEIVERCYNASTQHAPLAGYREFREQAERAARAKQVAGEVSFDHLTVLSFMY